MTNSNRIRLTWINLLPYTLTGALAIVAGVVMGNISDYFHLPISSIGSTFTFLSADILISISLNTWLVEIVSLKTQLRSGFILMALAVIRLMFSHGLTLFPATMFVLGLANSIIMSIGMLLVAQMYKDCQRSSRLLFADSFFSMTNMIFPMVAAFLLVRSVERYWVYACISFVYVAIFLLTFGCESPMLGEHAQQLNAPIVKEEWGIGILFLAVTTLCYILDQLGFISWVPEYAKNLGIGLNDAGKSISDFWMSYTVSMWAFSFIPRFFDLQRILTIPAGLVTVLMHLFIVGTPEHMPWLIMTLDSFFGAVYITIITPGPQQTKVASSKLVNFVLTYGATDTTLAFAVASLIVAHSGPQAALQTVNGLYTIVFVMCFILGFVMCYRQHNAPATY